MVEIKLKCRIKVGVEESCDGYMEGAMEKKRWR